MLVLVLVLVSRNGSTVLVLVLVLMVLDQKKAGKRRKIVGDGGSVCWRRRSTGGDGVGVFGSDYACLLIR